MGLLKADQIRNAAGTGNIDLWKQWAAKAWANANGITTTAIRESKNVASITDLGTGATQFNLTSALINANYALLLSLQLADNGSRVQRSSDTTAGAAIMVTYNGSGTAADANAAMMSIQGDLA